MHTDIPIPLEPTGKPRASDGAVRVLIVDDDAFMIRLLATMLARLGDFEIRGESDPQVALRAVREHGDSFDAVVLDLNMPGVDGMAFLRHLAQIGYAGCVVPFSGEAPEVLDSVAQLARAHGLHVAGALSKPPRREQLQALPWACAGRGLQQPAVEPAWQPAETDLREALAQGQVECFYQPKVDVHTGALAGFEALARWRHPSHGLVPPGRFVPLAESCGAISELTRRVFEASFAQQAQWRARGLDVSVSVNAAARDLADLGFVDFVCDCAGRHDVPPASVVIEVTESQLGGDPRLLAEVMGRLRLRRFELAIDDFGSGYASLSQLRDVIFDEIKIDRDFTHAAHESLRSKVLFDSSATLGRRLGMRVVAEGVEDRLDWEFCRGHGVHLAQGNFIGRPMPAADVPRWHDAWSGRVVAQRLAPLPAKA